MTRLCKYSISSAFRYKVPLGMQSNLLEALLSTTETGTYTLAPSSMTSLGQIYLLIKLNTPTKLKLLNMAKASMFTFLMVSFALHLQSNLGIPSEPTK